MGCFLIEVAHFYFFNYSSYKLHSLLQTHSMKKILFAIFFLSAFNSLAQIPYAAPQLKGNEPEWVQLLFQPTADPGIVSEKFKAYYKTHMFEKNYYTQYYKHWMMLHSSDNNGSQFGLLLDDAKYNQTQYLEKSKLTALEKAANWQCIGPFDFDKEAEGRSYAAGAAHVYTTEQSISNTDILYAGTANAGVWKSIDKGNNWVNLTKDMMLGSVIALEIDRTNPDIVYFGGAGKVYKTIDGGAIWTITGDATFNAAAKTIRDIVQSPVNADELWMAADQGFYHTTDGGANWVLQYSSAWKEIEIHPTNSQIMYAIKLNGVKTEFYKSYDGGQNFVNIINGYPTAAAPDEQKRTEIAVTPAAPNIVYALATGEADGGTGLYGIYVSHDAGESWSFQCCGTGPGGLPDTSTNKNLCGWDDHGGDDGGQWYYDLALEVSPFDSNEVHVGAVNHWISYDGGSTWFCPSKWSHSGKVNYVHADIHDIHFYGNDWWISCDGGIFYSQSLGDTFNRKQFGIAGTDFWGFGMGEWEGNEVMVGGTYHNGTLLRDFNTYTNGWLSTMGGDNVLGAVNYGDSRIIFSDYGRHKIPGDRTVNLSNLGTSLIPNNSYIVGEASEFEFHPNLFNTIYIGKDSSIWKSDDQGTTYSLLYNFGDGIITSIEVSPTNPSVIYACYYLSYSGAKKLFRTANAGQSWMDVTPAASVFNNISLGVPFDIAVSSTNENELFLVRVQQSSQQSNLNGYKVFKTTDGGTNWTNITTPMLDGEYPTCIEHQRGTDGGVYIGTRRAVYYRNNSMTDWELYNSGLPASIGSTQVLIDYKEGKVINATDRSVWESPVYEPSIPQAIISADKNVSHCTRDTIYFHDHSNLLNQSTTSTWSFPGGNPSSSTLRNPKVLYAAPGLYSVTLTAANSVGTSTQTLTNFITVYNECFADTVPGNCLSLNGTSADAIGPNLNLNSNTVTMTAWIKPNGAQGDWSGIIFSRGGNTTSGISMKDDNEIRMHWDGTEWGWSSGLYAPIDEWSYVALVVTPDSATIYVNGITATNIGSMPAEEFDCPLTIGLDNCCDRFFNGLIDEVCIYNRSLSKNEIRDLMHLTKKPLSDTSLVRYYQFDESSGPILDKVKVGHANLNGGASRVISSGPFGGGNSFRKNISVSGNHDFINTGFIADWTSGATLPNGEVVVTRINLHPDETPAQNWNARSYWILDNYGANEFFDLPQQIAFDKIGTVSAADQQNPNRFKIYLRHHNADGNTWGTQNDSANQCTTGTDGSVQFANIGSFVSSSQFDIINSSIVVIGTQEILSENYEMNATIFPSPILNTDKLFVKTICTSECRIELFSSIGQKVSDQKFTKETSVSLKGLPAGIYHYTFYSSDYEQNGEIVVQ